MSVQELIQKENKLDMLLNQKSKMYILKTSPVTVIKKVERLEQEIINLEKELEAGYLEMNQILEGRYEN
jgi:hypothetical protein